MAINILAIQRAPNPEEFDQRLTTLRKSHVLRIGSGNHNKMNIIPHPWPVSPINLSHVTLYAVSLNSITRFARYRTAELSSLTFPPKPITHKTASPKSGPLLEHLIEITSAAQPLNFGKRVPAWQTSYPASSLYGQALATLSTSPSQHQPTSNRCHTSQKTMSTLPPAIGGLIRTFHDLLLSSAGIVRRSGQPVADTRVMPLTHVTLIKDRQHPDGNTHVTSRGENT